MVEPTATGRREGSINALQNGLAVLDMFEPEHPSVTVGEIARHLDIHKSTASRIASTMVFAGFLRPAPRGSGFQLTGKMSRLASVAAADTTLTNVAAPILDELVREVGETCHLGVLEGRDAVTVALADGRYSVRMHSYVGKRSPAYATAMGKSILAHMPPEYIATLWPSEALAPMTPLGVSTRTELLAQIAQARERGYAIDDEELELGLRCVAAPVFDHENRVIASLVIAGAASRILPETLDELGQRVMAYAHRISAEFGAPTASAVGA